jgi:hypothetical protein
MLQEKFLNIARNAMKIQCFDDKQVKKKIQYYNKQRIAMSVLLIIAVAILLLVPSFGAESAVIRIAVFGSIAFILLSILFVLTWQRIVLIFVYCDRLYNN